MIPPICPIGAGEWTGHPRTLIAPLYVHWCLAKLPEAGTLCPQRLVALWGSRSGAPQDGRVRAIEPWKPWPAHSAFLDEVHRWWPNESPPPVAAPIADEISFGERQRVLLWRGVGGLIDFLA